MSAIIRGKQAYHDDPDTRVLIDRLSINSPLDQPTILQLPAAYRTAIARNLLGLLEGRLAYYDPAPTVSKQIFSYCRPTFSPSHNLYPDACNTCCWAYGRVQDSLSH